MAPESYLLIGVLLIFAAVVTVMAMFVFRSAELTGTARSLAMIERGVSHGEVARNELAGRDRLLIPLLQLTRHLGLSISPRGTAARISRNLDVAGNPTAWPVERVLGAKGILVIVGGLLGLLIGGLTVNGLLFGAVGAAAGLFLPDLLVYNVGLKRQQELRRGLAEAMDMLTVCMEAGQGFDGGMMQVSRNVDGPVAGEFARVLSEVQIGKTRGQAFRGLGERTTVPEIKTFVSAIVQADRLGLPIANVLREQAKEMRLARRQHAEELAQKVPVKILFPMLFCIFPALMIVVIGPGMIRISSMFGSFGG